MEEQVARNSLAFYRFIIAIFLHKGQEFEGTKGIPVRIVHQMFRDELDSYST